ncbi:MAG: cation transporter [Candidatus Marinimicrobia bacterium]|nr:cation transporter [Candidatus Neomarinimicrobiota bacterium]
MTAVDVNLEAGTARVNGTPEKEAIKAAVKHSGYKVKGIL